MPYIFLIIGVLVGLYALYRFFLNANIAQIKSLFLSAMLLSLSAALFFMAVTGKLAAALGLMVALAPVIMAAYREWKKARKTDDSDISADQPLKTRKEALEILGLDEHANEEDIKAAYKKLMQKVHPDAEGSEWMAAKLNQARDILLNKSDGNA